MARRQLVKTATGKITFARTVSLVYLTKTDDKWIRVPVTIPDVRNVKGFAHIRQAMHAHREDGIGRYQFRLYRDGKTQYENVPDKHQNSLTVKMALDDKKKALIKEAHEGNGVQIGRPKNQTTIAAALAEYTKAKAEQAEGKGKKKSSTGGATELAVKAFIAASGVELVKDVTAESIEKFAQGLTGHHNTVRRKLKNLRAFLMAAVSGDVEKYVKNDYAVQANRRGDSFFQNTNEKVSALFGKTIKHEQTPDVRYYHRNEIAAMREAFAEGTFERVACELYYGTGLRAAEGTHLLWDNVSMERNTITIEAIDGTWTSKTGKYRTVDVSDSLMRTLKAWKENAPSKTFVLGLGNDDDPQDYNVVREMLNTAAKNAGVSFDINLKTFRSTHACECLWGGFDVYTVSARLGHSKAGENNHSALATTIKYLLPNPYIQRTALNSIFGD